MLASLTSMIFCVRHRFSQSPAKSPIEPLKIALTQTLFIWKINNYYYIHVATADGSTALKIYYCTSVSEYSCETGVHLTSLGTQILLCVFASAVNYSESRTWRTGDVLPDATIVTTIDDDVLELCTRTVANTPIISPPIGFWSSLLCENAAPVKQHYHHPIIIHITVSYGFVSCNVKIQQLLD